MSALIDAAAARPVQLGAGRRTVGPVSAANALQAARDAVLASPHVVTALVAAATVGGCTWIVVVLLALPRAPAAAAGVALSPLLVAALVTVPWTRTASVVCGGLLVLGGDDSVGPIKIVYGALVVLCVALSVFGLLRSRAPWIRPFRLLLVPAAALMTVLIIGAAFSPEGWSPLAVVRGSVFWLLISAAPILGVDAARSLSPTVARRAVAVLGLVTSVGFATHWLELRGVSILGLGHWLMPTVVVPAVGFTVAFVQAALTRGRVRVAWAALAAATLVTMVASGSRTNLLIVIAAIGTLGAARLARVPVRRALGAAGIIIGVVSLAVPALAPIAIANPDFFVGRLRTLTTVFSGALGTDPSYLMRQDQQSSALAIIAENPLFGYGTGWVQDQVMDTPWITVVRIGIVGLAVLLTFLIWCGIVIVRSARGGAAARGHTVATGSALFFVCLLVVSSPVDDHGFGFALMLLFALVAADLRELWRPLHAASSDSRWARTVWRARRARTRTA